MIRNETSILGVRRLSFGSVLALPFLLLASLAIATSEARAHGPIHEQIANIDKQLVEEGASVELYFRRGRLFLIHEDWQAALQDFDRVEKLDPSLWAVDIFRAEARMGEGDFEAASSLLRKYLDRPQDGATSGQRARAYYLLGQTQDALTQPLEAARAYGASVDLLDRPTPDHFLSWARSLAKAGTEHLGEAIAALDLGNARLGSLVVLERQALQYEVEIRAYDRALQRLERLLEQSQRRESWWVEKGKVLLKADRPAEAKAAFEAAQTALESLPSHRRQTRAMVELALEIQNQLGALKAAESGS